MRLHNNWIPARQFVSVFLVKQSLSKPILGLLKVFFFQEVDMVVAPITAASIREQVIDFASTAMYVEEMKTMIRIYDQDDSTLKLFAKPFKSEVWICIGVSLLLGTFAMWIIHKLNVCFKTRISERTDVTNCSTLPTALWFTFGAILNQGKVSLIMFQLGGFPHRVL